MHSGFLLKWPTSEELTIAEDYDLGILSTIVVHVFKFHILDYLCDICLGQHQSYFFVLAFLTDSRTH
jgi:hypothetical protein